jgi:PAS domain S-box-containing protein
MTARRSDPSSHKASEFVPASAPHQGAPFDQTDSPSEDATLQLDETAPFDEPWLGRLATADGLFVTDERQRVRVWSSAAQRMLGYTPEDILGQPCYGAIMGRRPEGHPVCSLSCPVTRNARRGRGTAAYEVTAQAKDGTPRYLTNSVLVIQGRRGSFRVIHMMRESFERPPSRPGPGTSVPTYSPAAETLTRREIEVLRLFARGLCLDEVAGKLSISVFTARNHNTSIQHKLGVRNRLQMVLEGMRRGLV